MDISLSEKEAKTKSQTIEANTALMLYILDDIAMKNDTDGFCTPLANK